VGKQVTRSVEQKAADERNFDRQELLEQLKVLSIKAWHSRQQAQKVSQA
jgi:hypothetical protein